MPLHLACVFLIRPVHVVLAPRSLAQRICTGLVEERLACLVGPRMFFLWHAKKAGLRPVNATIHPMALPLPKDRAKICGPVRFQNDTPNTPLNYRDAHFGSLPHQRMHTVGKRIILL